MQLRGIEATHRHFPPPPPPQVFGMPLESWQRLAGDLSAENALFFSPMGEREMIRALSQRPLSGYLSTHHFNGKTSTSGRFVMGCGAVFMVQRVRAAMDSLTAACIAEETDTALLKETLALIATQKLDIIPLAEAPRRLAESNYGRRFVCFTFDGAYRSVLETVQPLFTEYGAPYAVFVGSDFLACDRVPWWMALEALVRGVDRIMPVASGLMPSIPCRTPQEKRDAHQYIAGRLAAFNAVERARLLHSECERHHIAVAPIAAREFLSGAELKAFARDPLVTLGTLAGGSMPLREMGYDEARDDIAQSLDALEKTLGARPRHLAFPGGHDSNASARDVKIAASLGLETAVTGLEGALWPEHAETLCALPRIALSNDPTALMRVLLLGGAGHAGEITAVGRKIA